MGTAASWSCYVRLCSIDDCGKEHMARGYCNLHWKRWRRYGDADKNPKDFWTYVTTGSGCWVWHGSMTNKGYGVYQSNRVRRTAHRIAFETFYGPIPGRLVIDHLCRNRACVNPLHLEPVTAGENTLRGYGTGGINARKTHCKRGHILSKENIYNYPGVRACKICAQEKSRIRHAMIRSQLNGK